MKPDEKRDLLALFDAEAKWCQGSEARDIHGQPVRYDDATAVAWDLVGGMCRLFGWRRATQLFGQLERCIGEQTPVAFGRDEDIAAMAALFDFNDASDTTYDKIVQALESMPVARGRTGVTQEL